MDRLEIAGNLYGDGFVNFLLKVICYKISNCFFLLFIELSLIHYFYSIENIKIIFY